MPTSSLHAGHVPLNTDAQEITMKIRSTANSLSRIPLRRRPALAAAFALCTTAIASPAFAGTWTPLTHQPTFEPETALLLTDGGVLVHAFEGSDWWRLDPDVTGSYVNGTWKQVASLPSGYTPLFFASAVLPDGRAIVEGGEYNDPTGPAVYTNLGAIYDPATNIWTRVNPPVGWSTIGDAQSVVLANGIFMLAESDKAGSRAQALLDPLKLTWADTGANKADTNHEEGWTLLPSGKVLTVDNNNGTQSELYNPLTGAWASAGSTGVSLVLVTQTGTEIGPAVLMPDGRVFQAGGTVHTALFGTNGVWTQGPDFPVTADGQVDAADAPAALLPNGNVLIATSPGFAQPKIHFFEFDGARFLPEEPQTRNAPNLTSTDEHFLVLPTGQVLAIDFSNDVEIYTPSGSPNPAWAPTISSVSSVLQQGTSQSISGTQFNGLSQGAYYGDDAQMATNYPLVRVTMTASGHVYYFKTHGHSTMAVATGSQTVSTTFDVPAHANETGPASLQVVANGIPSAPVNVCIPQDQVASCIFQCGGTASDGCGGTVNCGGGDHLFLNNGGPLQVTQGSEGLSLVLMCGPWISVDLGVNATGQVTTSPPPGWWYRVSPGTNIDSEGAIQLEVFAPSTAVPGMYTVPFRATDLFSGITHDTTLPIEVSACQPPSPSICTAGMCGVWNATACGGVDCGSCGTNEACSSGHCCDTASFFNGNVCQPDTCPTGTSWCVDQSACLTDAQCHPACPPQAPLCPATGTCLTPRACEGGGIGDCRGTNCS